MDSVSPAIRPPPDEGPGMTKGADMRNANPEAARVQPARRRTEFVYDPQNDIVIATPHWRIESVADVITWRHQYETFLKPFHRKMDLVIMLGDFQLATKLSEAWGGARARIHREYTRFSIRVHPTDPVRPFIYTSSVRHDLSADQARTLGEAILMIKKLRAARREDEAPRSLLTKARSERASGDRFRRKLPIGLTRS